MKMRYLLSVLAVLVALRSAAGQMAEAQANDPTEEAPAPRHLPENGPSAVFPVEKVGPKVFTFDGEYLFWYFRSERVPLDLAISADNLTDITTIPLTIDPSKRGASGMRLSVGWWDTDRDPILDQWGANLRSFGYEISGLFFGKRGISFRNELAPVIFRPFFDFNNHRPSAVFVAAPGLAAGDVVGNASSSLWGIEANIWNNICNTAPATSVRLGIMAGFRNLNLESDLNIHRHTIFERTIGAQFPTFLPFAGNRIEDVDSIAASNHFFGGQLGGSLKAYIHAAELSATFKLGLGWNHEVINFDGRQVRTLANGTRIASPGSLFALPSNIGTHTRNRFSVLPELNLNISIPIGNQFAINGGYTLLYWDRTVRPSDQIDRVIDITQIPSFPAGTAVPTGQPHPGVLFRERNLFLHGLNVGFTFYW
jgi:hypothetical protein